MQAINSLLPLLPPVQMFVVFVWFVAKPFTTKDTKGTKQQANRNTSLSDLCALRAHCGCSFKKLAHWSGKILQDRWQA
jgi:hypothetical protein